MVNTGETWNISCSQEVLARIRALKERAATLHIQADFKAVVESIHQHLSTDPLNWGDPLYRYPNLGLLQCRGTYRYLHVYFAVDEDRKIVYVTKFQVVSRHPLGESS